MQQGINQHGAVTIRQDKPIAICPGRIGRIVLEMIVPQDFSDIRHTHGCTRVTGVCLLHRIHTQSADSIGEFFAR